MSAPSSRVTGPHPGMTGSHPRVTGSHPLVTEVPFAGTRDPDPVTWIP